MKIRDCYKKITGKPDLIKKDDSINDVVRKVSENPVSRSVFVVDDEQTLVGIITISMLFRVIRTRYIQEDALTLFSELSAETAADIMGEPISVSPDDDLEDALKIAVQHDLQDLPVTKNGKVVGDLNCFEILENL